MNASVRTLVRGAVFVASTTLQVGAAWAQGPCETIGTVVDSLRGERPVSRRVFAPAEELVFSVQYGLITAGEARMRISPQVRQREGRPTFEIVTTATSSKMFASVYPVNDRVVSYMDTLHLRSVRFEKHLREGTYKKDLWIVFDQENNEAHIDGERTCDVEPNVQDILSSLYYVRTLDLRVGESVYVPNHDNGKNYPLEVKVLQRERVTVDAGTFDCLVLEPVLMGDAIFKQKGRLKVWVTDDEVKMPVLMKSKIAVGAIASVLKEFKLGGRFAGSAPPAMLAGN